MDNFLIPCGLVALAEIGDKTQLLALVLAAKFRKPLPIALGILAATLLNHALAGALGQLLVALLGPQTLSILISISFLGMAAWMLIPDSLAQDDEQIISRLGVFGASALAFFMAEMGDKTQIATVALAAHYGYANAILGSTLGVMLANLPVLWLGQRMTQRLPMQHIHRLAALLFFGLGILTFIGTANV